MLTQILVADGLAQASAGRRLIPNVDWGGGGGTGGYAKILTVLWQGPGTWLRLGGMTQVLLNLFRQQY